MRNITIENGLRREGAVEVVERKGLGHPDSLCDGIAEDVSVALSRAYVKETGHILHHNVDKLLIAAGEADVRYGGGKLTKPIRVILAGRAIAQYGKHAFDVPHLAVHAAHAYLKANVRNLNVEDDVIIDSQIGRGSADLVGVFARKGKKSSNDTSFGTGYAPFSPLEQSVLAVEKALNSAAFKKRVPACGEDIKVMGLREKDAIKLTVACAFVSKFVSGLADYKEAKARVEEEARRVVERVEHKTDREVEIAVNTADDFKTDSVYLTVTGTSAENGDDGSVGRGNRVNGLITPMRPMSLEAAAGKNPLTHVGKIYNVGAFKLASDLVKVFPEVRACDVTLLAQIGSAIDDPKEASITCAVDDREFKAIHGKIREFVDDQLARIPDLTRLLVEKKVTVF